MPYIIQVEIEPKGNKTACLFIDLENVGRVALNRENGELNELSFMYDNELIGLNKERARFFLDQYEAFHTGNIKARAPEAEVSPVIVTGSSSPIITAKR